MEKDDTAIEMFVGNLNFYSSFLNKTTSNVYNCLMFGYVFSVEKNDMPTKVRLPAFEL